MFSTTNQDAITFINAAGLWLERDAKDPSADSKFRYALRKVARRVGRLLEKFNETVEDINVEYASLQTKDKFGNDLKEPVLAKDEKGQYTYTPAGQKARTDAYRRLIRANVEVEPFIAIPPSPLSDNEAEAFEGFVLPKPVEAEEPVVETVH